MQLTRIVFTFLLLFTASFSYADIVYVTNGGSSGAGSLNDGVAALNSNDTLIINYQGIFGLNNQVLIENDTNITIIGPQVIHFYLSVEAFPDPSIFKISGCQNVTISGMNFRHIGYPAQSLLIPSFIIDSSSVSFYDCVFEGHESTGDGGAIIAGNETDLSIYNCSFIENTATGKGGAVFFDATDNKMRIENCTFYKNEAGLSGGAVYIDSVNTFDNFFFQNNTFYENSLTGGVTTEGQAVNFNTGPFTALGDTYVYFFHNLFYRNGASGNYQVNYTNSAVLGLMIYAENNYVLNLVDSDTLNMPINFRDNQTYDHKGIVPADLHLRSSLLTDGYGLKYFTITDASSVLLNKPERTGPLAKYTPGIQAKDCRRAPRVLLNFVDIGASEYTPYRITNLNSTTWETTINDLNTNAASDNYIEFDISSHSSITDHIPVELTVASINVPVYIDGFSQPGSVVPGPSNFGISNDQFFNASGLITLKPDILGSGINGIEVNSSDVTIAGLDIAGFDLYGVQINNGADNFKLQGCHVGVDQIAVGFDGDVDVGNELGGINILGDDAEIGGYFLHERNVLTGNGFSSTTGANIVIGNSNNTSVVGNVVGLAPNGKDSLAIEHTNAPHGVYLNNAVGSTIGFDYIFGKNIISSHIGSGIYHDNAGKGNTISFNHLGTTFFGDEKRPNLNGVHITNSNEYYEVGLHGSNVISGNLNAGVYIEDTDSVSVFGNTIGGNFSLTDTLPNLYGVEIVGNSKLNRIGGDDYENDNLANVIIGNDVGVYLHGDNVTENHVKGNRIGVTTHDGTTAEPNIVGVKISEGADHNLIGYADSTTFEEQINIISGNTDEGILIEGTNTASNIIKSNVIGSTNPWGTPNPLGNAVGVRILNVTGGTNYIGSLDDSTIHLLIHHNTFGVKIDSSNAQIINNAFIGIDTLGNEAGNQIGVYISPTSTTNIIGGGINERNVISGNDSAGIFIDSTSLNTIAGNYIGTDHNGLNSKNNNIGIGIRNGADNTIDGNVISGNDLGVYLTNHTGGNYMINNYVGLSADGTSVVPNSDVGLYIKDVDSTNFIGLDLNQANFFANDSASIYLDGANNQEVKGNLVGFSGDSSAYLGTPSTGVGIYLNNSGSNMLGGLGANQQNAISNKRVGVLLFASDSNRVQNTYLGNNPAGNALLPGGAQFVGVGTRGDSKHNTIGPDNVFGGNRTGIILSGSADSNLIYSNYLGIDTSLTNVIANDSGLIVSGSKFNLIGGINDSLNIFVNGDLGVGLRASADSNNFFNNYVGLLPDGTVMANSNDGVRIHNSSGNHLGAINLNQRNHIANNGGNGITITGTSAGNSLLRNSIYNNTGLAIDIAGDGPTDNNTSGVQDNIQMPVIESGFPCTGTSDIRLAVSLRNLVPGDPYYLDIYNISNGLYQDALGYGESGPESFYFDTIFPTTTDTTLIIDLSTYGLNIASDTAFSAMLTSEANGSSSELSKMDILLSQPDPLDITNIVEVCKWADNGMLIFDNSDNSAYNYSFVFDGTQSAETSPDSLTVNNLAPGNYTLDLIYDNGCAETYNQTMIVGPTFTASSVLTPDTCGVMDGTLTLTATPDTPAYFTSGFEYSDDNGVSFGASSVFTGLDSGTVINSVIRTDVGGTICYSDTITDIVPGHVILPTDGLNFTYSSFCEDTIGNVIVAPTRNGGTYSLITLAAGAVFDDNTGELSNVSSAGLYEIFYKYGSCHSDTNSILIYNVPSDSFAFNDFCQNENNVFPVPVTPGGAFTLGTIPVGNGGIIGATGQLVSTIPGQDLTAGTYEVIYDTQDGQCPRQDTVFVNVMSKPTPAPVLSSLVTSVGLDTAFFCPTSIDTVFTNTDPFQTFWFLEGQPKTGPDGFYVPNLLQLPAGSTDTLYAYHTIDYAVPSVLTCVSDTSSIKVHMYNTPVDPVINFGDTGYCANEIVLDLETASGDNVNWYQGNTVTQVSINSNSYTIPTQVYNNSAIPFFAVDSTGIGCLSSFVGETVTFHNSPVMPDLTALDTTVTGDTANFCPNALTDVTAAPFLQTLWFLEGQVATVTPSSTFTPSSLPANSYDTLYAFNTIAHTSPYNKTCSSDTASIKLHMYDAPIDPVINFGDTGYCANEIVLDLETASGDAVNWYEGAITNPPVLNTNIQAVTTPALPYTGTDITYFAQDSTGIGCVSAIVSSTVDFHDSPVSPVLSGLVMSGDTAYFCPGSVGDITAAPSLQTLWFLEGQVATVTPSSTFTPSSLPANSYDTLYAFNTIAHTSPYNKTCSSDTASIKLHMYDAPIDPVINFGDTGYCANEIVLDLETASGDAVNWYEGAITNPPVLNTNIQAVTTPALPYTGTDITYFAQDSTGIGCVSAIVSSTVDFHDSPVSPVLSGLVMSGDTAYFCPGSVGDITAAPSLQTLWFLEGQVATVTPSSTFTPSSLPANSYDTLYAFNTITHTSPYNKICSSDTASIKLHMYDAPIDPVINFGDTGYCANEIVMDLETASGDAVNWYEGAITNPPVLNTNTQAVTTPALPYTGTDITYFAQDSTGIGCVSAIVSSTVDFHDSPVSPVLSGLVMSGDTAYFCPGSVGDITAAPSLQTLWFLEGQVATVTPNSTFTPSSLPANSYDTLYAFNTITHTSPYNKTCSSDTASIKLHMYDAPVDPVINFGDTSYCEGELVDTLVNIALGTHAIYWYQDNTTQPDSVNSPNFVINAPLNYNDDVISIYARDSTGIGCFSDFDTTMVVFNPNPDEPSIINGDMAYCEGDLILALSTTPASVNWYENDTTVSNNVAVNLTDYLPVYNFTLGDSTITYYAQEVSAAGCKSPFDTTTVTFHPKPDLPVLSTNSALLTYCPDEALDTLSTDVVSHWLLGSDGSGLGVDDSLEIPSVIFNAGVMDSVQYYHVDLNNCHSDTGNIDIQIFDVPDEPIISTLDTTYCDGDQTYEILEVTNVTGLSGAWYSGPTNQVGTSFSYNILNTLGVGDTTFYFDYIDANGCQSSTDSIDIYTYEIPATAVISAADSVYCDGEPIEILQSSENTTWYLGPPDQNVILSANMQSYLPDLLTGSYTIYTQYVVNECASAADSIEVIIHELPATPLIAFSKSVFCDYDEDGTVYIASAVEGNWYENNDFSTPIFTGVTYTVPVASVQDSIVYHAQIVDDVTGCVSALDSVTIYVTDTDLMTAGEDVYLCKGYSAELNASGGVNYTWGNILEGKTLPNPMVSPLVETEYWVTINDEHGCFVVDTVVVFMELQANCSETIYTAFSPNGDGVNETWIIEGIEGYETNVVYIYNRWGDLIAKIDNYDNINNVWDGFNQSTGTPVVHGTYYFLLESGGQKINDGWVQVVK